MKITVVGTGYVGLVSGTCFAETGVSVMCVDVDKEKIEKLNQGHIPIYEPGLEELVKKCVARERLRFSTSLADSVLGSDAIFIAVGTPPDEDGSADLKYVLEVAREIGSLITDYTVVVTKSTVPVGTSLKVKAAIQAALKERGEEIPFDVASNPEFLKEGNAVDDFLKPDRIVVGTESKKAQKVMKRLYKPFVLNGHPILFMDIPSAEVTKYAANSMLATKISFMNDIANLCELVGADVNQVRKGIGSDSRIGNRFIYPGTGYGGSCFPKDVQALIRTAKQYGHPLRILKAVEEVNYDQKETLFKKIMTHFNQQIEGKTFAIWGLSFKPQTDDMREAPSLVLIDKLLEQGAKVQVYDPVAMDECKRKIGNKVIYSEDEYEAAIEADGLCLVTEWTEFRIPNYRVLSKLMKNLVIFDGRNIYDKKEVAEFGFSYYGIGSKPYICDKETLVEAKLK